MPIEFHENVSADKVNVAIYGEGGAGKTHTVFALAHALCERVAVVDTEHKSAAQLARKLGFGIAALDTFSPEQYVEAIQSAQAAGFDGIILDSLSPEWDGPGGCLSLVDQIVRSGREKSSFAAWKHVTPRHRALMDLVNRAPINVFATYRSHQDLELVTGDDGKKTVKSHGEAPIVRDDFMYEFDLVLSIRKPDHTITIEKTRVDGLPERTTLRPDPAGAALVEALKRYRYRDSDHAPAASKEHKRLLWDWARGQGMDITALAELLTEVLQEPCQPRALTEPQALRAIELLAITAEPAGA